MTELELKAYLEENPSGLYLVEMQKGDEKTVPLLSFCISDDGSLLVYDNNDINRFPMETEEALIEYAKMFYSEEELEEKLECERKKIVDGYFYEIGCELYESFSVEGIISIEPISVEELLARLSKDWVD